MLETYTDFETISTVKPVLWSSTPYIVAHPLSSVHDNAKLIGRSWRWPAGGFPTNYYPLLPSPQHNQRLKADGIGILYSRERHLIKER